MFLFFSLFFSWSRFGVRSPTDDTWGLSSGFVENPAPRASCSRRYKFSHMENSPDTLVNFLSGLSPSLWDFPNHALCSHAVLHLILTPGPPWENSERKRPERLFPWELYTENIRGNQTYIADNFPLNIMPVELIIIGRVYWIPLLVKYFYSRSKLPDPFLQICSIACCTKWRCRCCVNREIFSKLWRCQKLQSI